MNFIDWFISNWYSNFFTLITVILSGVISLIISAIYYHKGNRNNLIMSVIYPIVKVLDEGYSRKNYRLKSEITKDYSTRYMSKKESNLLLALMSAYEEVSSYNDTCVNANILFSYFEYKLNKNHINVKPVPIEYEGEIVYYDYPPDLHYLSYDLEKVLKKTDVEIATEECKDAIIALYTHYCKEYYTSEHIEFFDDYSLADVLSKSRIREEWDKKFDKVKEVKGQFFNLKIVKDIVK